MMKLFALMSLLTLGFASASSASIISITADCTDNCSLIDMNTGDALSLEFELADELLVPSGSFSAADVSWFSFTAGSMEITIDTAVNFYIRADINSAMDGFYNFYFRASETNDPYQGDVMSVGLYGSTAATQGHCNNSECSSIASRSSSTVRFSGFNFTVGADEAEVPEPGVLGLLTLSLIGLGLYRRKG
ncbi:PEP-CTERM sorting domain-containing protein [Emcibacter sp.]|uniref:PEP-CTERM sorting domain-containing protein n=1 Tax=Emcibacter sp. TaxID=1979954 RepID=UPI003A8EFF49